MKKFISVLSAALIVLALLICGGFSAFALGVGSCGDGATYSFDSSTGILTISGNGEIDDFSPSSSPFASQSAVNKVVIKDGITKIGSYAFYNCKNMTDAVIPDSVNSIGESAFDSCRSLKQIFIPSGAKSISSGAFSGCDSLVNITVSEDNTVYDSRNNCNAIVETDTNTLIVGCANSVIPNTVSAIADYAFYDCSLSSVDIPYGVKSIGTNAFGNCTNLNTVNLPKSLNEIGNYAFSGCSVEKLIIPEGVSSIGKYAFRNCKKLREITIPNSVNSIGQNAFSGCYSLKKVNINSIKSWNNIDFKNQSSNPLAFAHFLYLNDELVSEVVIPDDAYSIGNWAFYECTALKKVTISNNIKSIGSGAFGGCVGIAEIDIPSSVQKIGTGAFADCTGLKNITLQNGVKIISNNAFKNCSGITEAPLPESVETIGVSAFYGCSSLLKIEIPPNVKSIGTKAFSNCESLGEIKVDAANAVFDSREGCSAVVNIKANSIICGCKNTVIPQSVKSISSNAFYECKALKEINLPDSLSSIGANAFYGCKLLESIKIPKSVNAIGNTAFYNCPNLLNIIICGNINSLGSNIFSEEDYVDIGNLYIFYGGSQEEWMSNTYFSDLTNVYKAKVHFNNTDGTHSYVLDKRLESTPNERGYEQYTCTVCSKSYKNIFAFASDSSALASAVQKVSLLDENAFSAESYAAVEKILTQCKNILKGDYPQSEIDDSVSMLLSAVNSLIPYANIEAASKNGSAKIIYNDSIYTDKVSALFGTPVTLKASAEEGYEFAGWYEKVTKRIFSTDENFTFAATSNMKFEALFVKAESSTLTFKNESGWIAKTVSRTLSQWKRIISLSNLLPDVPYKFGYKNGRWEYDENAVLNKLRNGEDVNIIAVYDEDTQPALPDEPEESAAPSLNMNYAYDSANDTASFAVNVKIPENVKVNSIGIAFDRGEKENFDPCSVYLTLSNKTLVSQFDKYKESGVYVVDVLKFSAKNWAAVGYVTYFDENNVLKTAYSNQVNVVDNEWVK